MAYHARVFSVVDSVNNTAGIGFNGYDDRGFPKWDQVSNIDPLVIEVSVGRVGAFFNPFHPPDGYKHPCVCYAVECSHVSLAEEVYC